jgi:hypothetical protein
MENRHALSSFKIAGNKKRTIKKAAEAAFFIRLCEPDISNA